MEQKSIPVTREGYDRLKAELAELTDTKRPQIIAAVAEARSHGDLRENAAYDAARQDQAMTEKRIGDLENLLRNARIIEGDEPKSMNGVIGLGSRVTVDFDGEDEQYTIVGAIEAKPSNGLISNESPIGRALMGRRSGENAIVETPGGALTVKIKSVE